MKTRSYGLYPQDIGVDIYELECILCNVKIQYISKNETLLQLKFNDNWFLEHWSLLNQRFKNQEPVST